MPQNNKPGRRLLRQLYGSWYRMRHNISIFARWCLFAVIIGVVVGAVGAAFEHALEWATETRQEQSWTLYFLPLVGVFIAFWYSKMDMPLERGTNFILTSVRQDHPVRLRLAPSIFITSVLTHLCGGSERNVQEMLRISTIWSTLPCVCCTQTASRPHWRKPCPSSSPKLR